MYLYLFLAIQFFVTFHTLYTGEHKNELPCPIERPTHVVYPRADTVAIAGNNGLAIVDIPTKKSFHFKYEHPVTDLAQSTELIATASNGVVRVHSTSYKSTNWSCDPEERWSFDTQSADNTIIRFVNGCPTIIAAITKNQLFFIANNNVHTVYTLPNSQYSSLYCSSSLLAGSSYDGCILSINLFATAPEQLLSMDLVVYSNHNAHIRIDVKKSTDIPYNQVLQKPCLNYLFSPDQKYHLFNHGSSGCCLQRVVENRVELTVIGKKDYQKESPQYIAGVFHPDEAQCALSHENKLLLYHMNNLFSVQKAFYNKPFCKKRLLQENQIVDNETSAKRLSFSPDGKFLVVALNTKCFLLPLPPAIIHSRKLQEKLIFMLFAIKHSDGHFSILPNDIFKHLIAKNIITLYEQNLNS